MLNRFVRLASVPGLPCALACLSLLATPAEGQDAERSAPERSAPAYCCSNAVPVVDHGGPRASGLLRSPTGSGRRSGRVS